MIAPTANTPSAVAASFQLRKSHKTPAAEMWCAAVAMPIIYCASGKVAPFRSKPSGKVTSLTYFSSRRSKSMTKPDIIGVISQRLELRCAGREHVGRCPFHDDRHPSLYVNPEKQVFLCRACQAGGDVFKFIMLLDGLTFPEACRALGMDRQRKGAAKLTPRRKQAAELAALWANVQRAKLNFLVIERMEQRDIADQVGAYDLAEAFDREVILLCGFYDALKYARGVAELLAAKASIEQITNEVEIIDEPHAGVSPHA
jgi:hypothetical protein